MLLKNNQYGMTLVEVAVATALTGLMLLVAAQLLNVQNSITSSSDTTADVAQIKNEIMQRINSMTPEGMTGVGPGGNPPLALSNCQKLLGGARCFFSGPNCSQGQEHPAYNNGRRVPQQINWNTATNQPVSTPLILYNVGRTGPNYNSTVFVQAGTLIANGKLRIQAVNFVPANVGNTILTTVAAPSVAGIPQNRYVPGNLELQVIKNNGAQLGSSMTAADPLVVRIPLTLEIQVDGGGNYWYIADCSSSNPESTRPVILPVCNVNQALTFTKGTPPAQGRWECTNL
jgi:hypothetical protein